MPRFYIEQHVAHCGGAREPFDAPHETNLMVELGATSPRDSVPGTDGEIPIVARLEEALAGLMEEGLVIDAVLARNEATAPGNVGAPRSRGGTLRGLRETSC